MPTADDAPAPAADGPEIPAELWAMRRADGALRCLTAYSAIITVGPTAESVAKLGKSLCHEPVLVGVHPSWRARAESAEKTLAEVAAVLRDLLPVCLEAEEFGLATRLRSLADAAGSAAGGGGVPG